MSPRPRRVSDDEVLDATERMMASAGPVRLTLEHIAAELGVTPPALLKRFGSKRALLLAVNERRVRRASARVERNPNADPLEELFSVLESAVRGAASSRDALANAYAFLHADLADPARRPGIVAQVKAIRSTLRDLVRRIVSSGKLVGDPRELADLLEMVYNGALISWMVDGSGAAWPFVRRRITLALHPYRPMRHRA